MNLQESHVQNNQVYYEALAAGYDDATRGRYLVNDLVAARLAEQPSPENIRSVLDLGAGTGLTIETVLQYVQPTSVVAVDFSAHMLEALKAKFPIPGLQTVQSDIDAFLVQNHAQFDLITAIGCLDLVPDPVKSLSTIGSHMASGGLFICTYEPQLASAADQAAASTTYPRERDGETWEFTVFRADREQVRQVLEAQQLSVVSSELIPAYPRGEHMIQYDLLVVCKP
ncbi:MAG TPA: class I SAM-dependent methyltransferase [Patescibacteria group bacterium]|nr:class I SAM-dependent methyltransferase [Patescibacteria group bacterium]